jgi:hypothetical protein
MLGLQQLNTLFIDSLQNASSTLEADLLQTFWSMSTARAEQNGFYRIFNDEFPSERAFMASLSPALAWGERDAGFKGLSFQLRCHLPCRSAVICGWIWR